MHSLNTLIDVRTLASHSLLAELPIVVGDRTPEGDLAQMFRDGDLALLRATVVARALRAQAATPTESFLSKIGQGLRRASIVPAGWEVAL